MSFKRPRKEDLPEVLDLFEDPEPCCFKDPLLNNVSEKRKRKIAELRLIVPKAAVFTSISKFAPEKIDNSDTDTADEDETNSLPEPLTSLYDPLAINWSEEDIETMGKKIYERYIRSHRPYQFENLCNVTRTQSLNPNWKLHRTGRITASQALSAYRCDVSNPSITFINTIMQYVTVPNVKAIKYGREHEGLARTCYENLQKCRHTNFKIQLTGLHIDARFPALGPSPDALLNCDCHGMGVLEIKCPEKYMNGLFNWQKDKKFPVTKTYEIKRNHPYFYEMQMQMLLTKRSYCDVFVWLKGKENSDKLIVRVDADISFQQELKAKLINVFEKVILPECITRKHDPNNEHSQKLYCSCKRPSFEPMIACDGKDCQVEWYHYVCVGITRAPKGSWICSSCKTA